MVSYVISCGLVCLLPKVWQYFEEVAVTTLLPGAATVCAIVCLQSCYHFRGESCYLCTCYLCTWSILLNGGAEVESTRLQEDHDTIADVRIRMKLGGIIPYFRPVFSSLQLVFLEVVVTTLLQFSQVRI